MQKIILILACIGIHFYSATHAAEEKTLFMGTIQFPPTVQVTPSIRIYYAGRKITTEIDQENNRILFSVPEQKNRSFFYLLITPEIRFVSHENTIEYLTLKPGLNHAFFALELMAIQDKAAQKRLKQNPFLPAPVTYTWAVHQLRLNLPSGRIPDETIIVCYDPTYVAKLDGGNAVEFPKIIMKTDLIKVVGSEKKLHDLSTQWFLTALNTDTIHEAPVTQIQLSSQAKTVLAFAT